MGTFSSRKTSRVYSVFLSFKFGSDMTNLRGGEEVTPGPRSVCPPHWEPKKNLFFFFAGFTDIFFLYFPIFCSPSLITHYCTGTPGFGGFMWVSYL